jgi:hypothetical protein
LGILLPLKEKRERGEEIGSMGNVGSRILQLTSSSFV